MLLCAVLLLLCGVRCVEGHAALYVDEPASLAVNIDNQAIENLGYQGFYGEAVGVTGVSHITLHHCNARTAEC